LPQKQSQCFNENRLSSSRFSSDHIKTIGKLNIEGIDDRQALNVQMGEQLDILMLNIGTSDPNSNFTA
jgi:hypothetical protein